MVLMVSSWPKKHWNRVDKDNDDGFCHAPPLVRMEGDGDDDDDDGGGYDYAPAA